MSGSQDEGPRLPLATVLVGGLAAVAVVLSVLALADEDEPAATGDETTVMDMGGMSMGPAAMEHMQPLSTEGITDATVDQGNSRLVGVRRGGALEFELFARPVWWQLYGGQQVAAWAYNGMVPGPLIRVENGQRVRIRFTNNLPDPTTIHWHGIGVPNTEDGVPGITQRAIEPAETYTYEFTARPAGEPGGGGTFLYHSHLDEDRQMAAGLYGTFIIDPPAGNRPSTYSVDEPIVISEWTADPESGVTRGVMQMEGMLPNFFSINGKSYPDTETIEVKAGERVLLRLVNAGQFEHPMHLHGTAFHVVARDGHPVAEPELRDEITLASGERADIAFTLPPGKWLLHCHIGHHLTNDGDGPGGLMTVVEAS